MNSWLIIIFIVAGFSGCSLTNQDGRFSQSSIQTVDMGKFNGLRIIEIASLSFFKDTDQSTNPQLFTELDQENLSDSLVSSLKKSDVEVVASAQTKIHVDFSEIVLLEEENATVFNITANVAVSRNGIVTRKMIEINGKEKLTLGKTKNNGMKIFILGVADLLREQSSYKR